MNSIAIQTIPAANTQDKGEAEFAWVLVDYTFLLTVYIIIIV